MAREQRPETTSATSASSGTAPSSGPADLAPGRGRDTEVGHELRTASSSSGSEEVSTALFNLRFSLTETVAYHAAREQFLARLGKALTGIQVMLGTSAVALIAENYPSTSIAVVGAAALTGVLLLVIDPSAGAREHRILRGRLHDLLAECEEQECDASIIRSLRAKAERLRAGGPPGYRAVQALAYNTAAKSLLPEPHASAECYQVSWKRRWLANFWPMRGVNFEKGRH